MRRLQINEIVHHFRDLQPNGLLYGFFGRTVSPLFHEFSTVFRENPEENPPEPLSHILN